MNIENTHLERTLFGPPTHSPLSLPTKPDVLGFDREYAGVELNDTYEGTFVCPCGTPLHVYDTFDLDEDGGYSIRVVACEPAEADQFNVMPATHFWGIMQHNTVTNWHNGACLGVRDGG